MKIQKYTHFWDEVESNEKEEGLSFEVVLLLIASGLAIGFFAVASTYAVYLGL